MRRPSLTRAFPVLAALILLTEACQPKGPPRAEAPNCAPGQAECVGNDQALGCIQGHYILTSCNGPRGCKTAGGLVMCDKRVKRFVTTTAANPGDPCGADLTCAKDQTTLLQCDGGTLKAKGMCRGPRGCTIVAGQVQCDQSIAEAGDECTGTGAACTTDGWQVLECRDGRQVVKSACTTGCEVTKKLVVCHSGGVY